MMKKILYILFIIPLTLINAQRIGDTIVEKSHIDFPNQSLGIDLLIGEGGFGLGSFYRREFSKTITGFIDFSISESKHTREIERYDIFGYPLPIFGKKNRAFTIPLTFGAQYRLFYNDLTDNLRPYIAFGIGPSFVITTPANEEFFRSFKYAKAEIGLGGYVGLGANFGLSTKNLTGINIRYYYTQLFNGGIEQYYNQNTENIQQFSLIINIGIMY